MDFEADILNPSAVASYLSEGKGPLSSTAADGTAQFVSSLGKKTPGEENWPDLQWILIAASIDGPGASNYEHAFNVKPGVLQKYFESMNGKRNFQLITVVSRPKSVGQLTLASSDPNDYPIIDPKYYDNHHDMEVAIEGIIDS